ncbi:MAG: hypothetical protein GXP22_06490 [Gammaproteobacteria bacterium]|nr:hypothetical protein [Gammaproteobacteria bacterium]
MSEIETNTKKSGMTLWIMIVLFGLPYVAAMYVYMNSDEMDLGGGSNYGYLVTPARPLQDMGFTTLQGEAFQFSSMKGKWILLSVGHSACAEACRENLYNMRQIRKAVGQDTKRIERVFLLMDNDQLQEFGEQVKNYQGMTVLQKAGVQYEAFLSDFVYDNKNKVEDGLYVIDPLGNYMMAYPAGADPNNILKDVRRLLKVSQIG